MGRLPVESALLRVGILCLAFGVMFFALARSVSAQQVPTAADDPVAEAPVRFGVVAFDPRVSLTQLGVDTNVFNSTSNPESDFTFTVAPGTEMWLRTGRGLFSVNANVEFVYFHEFESERSTNSYAFGQYEFRFNKLRPYFSASTLNTRQRPGYEIDARARHYETDFHGGSDFRIASKSTLRVDVRYLDYIFAGDEVFNGEALNEELNRTTEHLEVSWRQRLTALTTWVTKFSRETQRFHFEDLRNSDSLRLNSGFELGRFALIRGSAYLGYRRLTPADGGIIREFSGLIAAVNVAYTAPTQTRLSVAVDRDIQYSYEERTPYYLQTGWTGTLTQRIGGGWDAQISGGRDRLAYEGLIRSAQTDFISRFGGGIGYTIGDQVRAGFDVLSFHRSSDIPGRDYGGVRAGASVTYGY